MISLILWINLPSFNYTLHSLYVSLCSLICFSINSAHRRTRYIYDVHLVSAFRLARSVISTRRLGHRTWLCLNRIRHRLLLLWHVRHWCTLLIVAIVGWSGGSSRDRIAFLPRINHGLTSWIWFTYRRGDGRIVTGDVSWLRKLSSHLHNKMTLFCWERVEKEFRNFGSKQW